MHSLWVDTHSQKVEGPFTTLRSCEKCGNSVSQRLSLYQTGGASYGRTSLDAEAHGQVSVPWWQVGGNVNGRTLAVSFLGHHCCDSTITAPLLVFSPSPPFPEKRAPLSSIPRGTGSPLSIPRGTGSPLSIPREMGSPLSLNEPS